MHWVIGILSLTMLGATAAAEEAVPNQIMLPSDTVTGRFGQSMDATDLYLIIGSPANNTDTGGFSIYQRVSNEWLLDFTSTPADYSAGDEAGFAVAISNGGDALVGMPGRGDGVIEAWHRDANTGWFKEGEVTAPLGTRFGAAIDMHEQRMVAGAPGGQGQWFYFQYISGNEPWQLLQTNVLEGGLPESNYGHAIAMQSDRIFVSAPGQYGGVIEAWSHDGLNAAFLESVSDALPWQAGRTGHALAVDGSILLASSPEMPIADSVGAVWGFHDDGAVGENLYGLAFYLPAPAGAGYVDWGSSIAINANHIAVGAPLFDGGDGLVTTAQLTWPAGDEGPVVPEDSGLFIGVTGSHFGAAVASQIDGLAIGLPGLDSNGGGVHWFEHPTGGAVETNTPTPVFQATLNPIDSSEQPKAVAAHGDLSILGFAQHNDGDGRLSVLQLDGHHWVEVNSIRGNPNETMGYDVAMCDGIIAAGCPNANTFVGTVRTWFIDSDHNLVEGQTLSPFSHANAHAGYAVDLHRSTAGDAYLIVGAPGIPPGGNAPKTFGAVAVYCLPYGTTNWVLVEESSNPLNGHFGTGYAVAVGEESNQVYALAGAPLFDFFNPLAVDSGIVLFYSGNTDPTSWGQVSNMSSLGFGGRFGSSLDADDNVAIIGQPGASTICPYGAAVVRTGILTETPYSQLLEPPTGWSIEWGFGASVAVSLDGPLAWAAIGVPGFNNPRSPDAGCAEVYLRINDESSQFFKQGRLQVMDADDINDFGGSVALAGQHLLMTNGPMGNPAPPSIMASTQLTRTANWIDGDGGQFENPANWSSAFEMGGTYRFALLDADPYPVFIDLKHSAPIGDLVVEFDAPMIIIDGGPPLVMTNVMVGSDPLVRAATLIIDFGVLRTTGDMHIGNAPTNTAGRLEIPAHGATEIDGHFLLAPSGSMKLGIGTETPNEHAYLKADTVNLGGAMQVIIESEAANALTEGFRIIISQSTIAPVGDDGTFDVVVLPGLPNGLAFELTYGPPPGVVDGAWEAAIEVVSLGGLLGFDDPNSLVVTGTPVALEVVDLTGDGADEVCVIFDGAPGQLIIFESDVAGNVVQQIIVPTGDQPTSLTSGDWDGDGQNDLAIGHISGDVRVLMNDDNDITDGFVETTILALGPVRCLAPVNMNFDGSADLMAGLGDTNGDGNGKWQWWHGQVAFQGGGLGGGGDIDAPGGPLGLDPSEEEDQKDYIAIGLLHTGQAVRLKGLGLAGMTQDTYTVGTDPAGLALADFNNDGRTDIAATSAGNGTVALLLGDATPNGFASAIYIPLGITPGDLAAEDLDGDGRVDLAAITTNDDGERVVRVLQNEGGLAFTSVDLAQGETPSLLSLGDVDGNGTQQLITIGGGTALLGDAPLLSLREVTSATCPGDIDGNGAVNVDDLMALIGQWGNDCEGGAECSADLDGNMIVDVDDLVMLIGLWGDC